MQEKRPAKKDSTPDSSNPSGKMILVVDDEKTILDLSANILKRTGYGVDTASDCEQAKTLILNNLYDLVIADVWMPGALSGMDLFRWIKENKPEMEKRVIFITGDTVDEQVRSFLEETQRPCLPKPFGVVEYLNVVQATMEAAS